MNKRKLLKRLLEGAHKNVRFDDLMALVEAFGFEHQRSKGSHHIFKHPDVEELLNLQEVKGEAKPYQIKQLLKLVEAYNLALEGNGE
jgi:predicted RNA binding protein YcfA (HicA-like mRNA interferase family)